MLDGFRCDYPNCGCGGDEVCGWEAERQAGKPAREAMSGKAQFYVGLIKICVGVAMVGVGLLMWVGF